MLKQKILQKISNTPTLGILPLTEDQRDILGWQIFGSDYKPKYTKKTLELMFPANTQDFNTCGWNSTTASHENIDEKIKLDERTLVLIAVREGKISGDGFSTLRDNEKMLQKFGVARKGLLTAPFRNWKEYSDISLLTPEILADAEKHRTKCYLQLTNVIEIYRAIDDGRTVKIGIGWRTAFNMGSGFSFPWLLNFLLGFLVGGHAMYIYGYDQEYKTKRVFLVRNSFGSSYGLNGDLYIEEADMEREMRKYGAYRNEDMDLDLAKWLVQHQGKIVKNIDNSAVYLIQGDKKRKYDDISTLIAHGKERAEIIIVSDEYLNQVKVGDPIHFWDGGNVKQVKELFNIIKANDPDVMDEMANYIKQLYA